MSNTTLHREHSYYQNADPDKVKRLGQYFTPEKIARFMASWVMEGTNQVLDPAAGNHIFYREAKRIKPDCQFTGYEIDHQIAAHFQVDPPYEIRNEDFLMSGWQEKYDAIVCNPPYNRFQAILNRKQILSLFYEKTGERYSGYTNQSILFLLKAIHQLSERGRLAFIMPAEFLNARYGQAIKAQLITSQLLRAVLYFNTNVFSKVITTSCILLLDKQKKQAASFYYLDKIDMIDCVDIERQLPEEKHIGVYYSELRKTDKWLTVFNRKRIWLKENCVKLSDFAQVRRGLATGHNQFFLFSKQKIGDTNIDAACFKPCISASRDVLMPVLNDENFEKMVLQQKRVFLLYTNRLSTLSVSLQRYLNKGIREEVHNRYLPKNRHPWHHMEKKTVSPIWIGTAGRNGIKVVRNLAGVLNLTAFHGLYPKPGFDHLTNLLFCYLLTSTAQSLLAENRKIMGNGLAKYQPNDLAEGYILDLTRMTDSDQTNINQLYAQLIAKQHKQEYVNKIINQMDEIFRPYLVSDR